MKKYHWAILPILAVLFFNCGGTRQTNQTIDQDGQIADQEVKIDSVLPCDHSGILTVNLDDENCGILLELPNGSYMQILELADQNFTFSSGDRVRVSFEVLNQIKSSCPKAMQAIRVTCMEEDWNISHQKSTECIKTIDAFSVEWMHKIIGQLDPQKITRYDFRNNQYAYLFEGSKGKILTDCFGGELCQERPGMKGNCEQIWPLLSNEYVILVVNNNEE